VAEAQQRRDLALDVSDTPMVRSDEAPVKRDRTALIGVKIASSGLMNPLPPLGCVTPTTVKGMPLMVTVWPTTSAGVRLRLVTVVGPRTATRRPLLTARSVRKVPRWTW
jgi:hypothetical protein